MPRHACVWIPVGLALLGTACSVALGQDSAPIPTPDLPHSAPSWIQAMETGGLLMAFLRYGGLPIKIELGERPLELIKDIRDGVIHRGEQ